MVHGKTMVEARPRHAHRTDEVSEKRARRVGCDAAASHVQWFCGVEQPGSSSGS